MRTAPSTPNLSKEERRKRREQKKVTKRHTKSTPGDREGSEDNNQQLKQLLRNNEDSLLELVAKINRTYKEKLNKDAPFMTFVLVGMQSTGKSTIMERFLHAVLNIVQDGTGTRCPLDTTCIHDASCIEPKAEIYGEELDATKTDSLSVSEVFKLINEHTKKLEKEDRFSTKALQLVFRSNAVQNMRFVDTPGIIANVSTGQDNREAIKDILSHEMQKANTKLCVLLEPTEYATNKIIDFCDETFAGRDEWINKATFLMTKFDKQFGDLPTGGKTEEYLREYRENECLPFFVTTPVVQSH